MSLDSLTLFMSQLVEGKPVSDLQPLFDELITSDEMKSDAASDDVIAIFKVLPRAMTCKHINRILDAEKATNSTEVSELLLESKFEGVAPLGAEKLALVMQHTVDTLASDAKLESALFECRCQLVANHADKKGIRAEEHAMSALVHAISLPSFLVFEPLLTDLSSAQFKPKGDALKQCIVFVKDVLVGGTGAAGYKAFVAKAGADFFTKLNVRGDVYRKAQIVSLSALLKGKEAVAYDELVKALDVKGDGEVESVVIDAAIGKMIDVRIDKAERKVIVHSVVPLQFESKEAWVLLQKQLRAYRDSVNGLVKEYEAGLSK